MLGTGKPDEEAAADGPRARKRRVAQRIALAALCFAVALCVLTFALFSGSRLSVAEMDVALRQAVGDCDAGEVRRLIALGAEVNRAQLPDAGSDIPYPTAGSVPLQAHSRCDTPDTLQALLEGGADLAPHLRRLADLAMIPPRPEVLAWLLDNGLDPNLQWRDLEGWETLLHRAARLGDEDLVRVVLQHGANPEALDSEGLTPIERVELVIAQEIRNRAIDPERAPPRIHVPEPQERFAPIIALLQEAVRSE